MGPIPGSSNSSPPLALIIMNTVIPRNATPTTMLTSEDSRDTALRPANTSAIFSPVSAIQKTMATAWRSRLWKAWNRTKRLFFSTIAATTEKINGQVNREWRDANRAEKLRREREGDRPNWIGVV